MAADPTEEKKVPDAVVDAAEVDEAAGAELEDHELKGPKFDSVLVDDAEQEVKPINVKKFFVAAASVRDDRRRRRPTVSRHSLSLASRV